MCFHFSWSWFNCGFFIPLLGSVWQTVKKSIVSFGLTDCVPQQHQPFNFLFGCITKFSPLIFRIQENDVSFPLIPCTVILYWKILFLGKQAFFENCWECCHALHLLLNIWLWCELGTGMLIRPPVSHTITVMLHALDQIESALVKLQRNSCSSLPNSST